MIEYTNTYGVKLFGGYIMDEFLEERELGSLLFALALVTDDASIDRIHLPKMNNKSIYTIKYKDFECNISTADATNYDIILQNFKHV